METHVPFNTTTTLFDIGTNSETWKPILAAAKQGSVKYNSSHADGIVYSMQALVPNDMDHVRILEYPYYVWKSSDSTIRMVICMGDTFHAVDVKLTVAETIPTEKPTSPNTPLPTQPIPYEDVRSFTNFNAAQGLLYYRVGCTFDGQFCEPSGWHMLPYWAAFLRITRIAQLEGLIASVSSITIPLTENPQARLEPWVRDVTQTVPTFPIALPPILSNLGVVHVPTLKDECTPIITKYLTDAFLPKHVPIAGVSCTENGRVNVDCSTNHTKDFQMPNANQVDAEIEESQAYTPFTVSTQIATIKDKGIECVDISGKMADYYNFTLPARFIKEKYLKPRLTVKFPENEIESTPDAYVRAYNGRFFIGTQERPMPPAYLPFIRVTKSAFEENKKAQSNWTGFTFSSLESKVTVDSFPQQLHVKNSTLYNGVFNFETFINWSTVVETSMWHAPKADKPIYCHTIYHAVTNVGISGSCHFAVVLGDSYFEAFVLSHHMEDYAVEKTTIGNYTFNTPVHKKPFLKMSEFKQDAGYHTVLAHANYKGDTLHRDDNNIGMGMPHWLSFIDFDTSFGGPMLNSHGNVKELAIGMLAFREINGSVIQPGNGDVFAAIANSKWFVSGSQNRGNDLNIDIFAMNAKDRANLLPTLINYTVPPMLTNIYRYIPDPTPRKITKHVDTPFGNLPVEMHIVDSKQTYPTTTTVSCDETLFDYSDPLTPNTFYTKPKTHLFEPVKLPKQWIYKDQCADTATNIGNLPFTDVKVSASYHDTLVRPFDYDFVHKRAKTDDSFFNYKGTATGNSKPKHGETNARSSAVQHHQ